MHHSRTVEAAKGKWRGILMELGIPDKMLVNKHGPCPLCAGTDRFRFDNKQGSGSWFCNNCGSGDGIELAQRYLERDFRDTANMIDRLTGNLKPDPVSNVTSDMSHEDRRTMLRETYALTEPMIGGDLAHVYFQSRGINPTSGFPSALRFAERLKDGEGGLRPCILAMVVDILGKPVSMHRTFLKDDGTGKAEMASPRKMMPGTLPDGACVRLTDNAIPRHIGIAEGIETALAARILYGIPTWAALNTAGMKKWKAPRGIDQVTVYADNDRKFGGQAAAYELAHKIAVQGLKVDVMVSPYDGTDFNDVLMKVER